jgi:hypothetical protein
MSIAKSQIEWLRQRMSQNYGVDDNPQTFDADFTVADKIMTQWGGNVVEALKKNLAETNKNASSGLSQSLRFEVKDQGAYIELKLYADSYYKNVNDGRRGTNMKWTDDQSKMIGKRKATAKLPPFDAISNWIRFKGVAGLSKKGLGYKTRQTSRVSDKVKKMQLVELIRRSIKRKGIEPTYFYTQVVNKETINDLTQTLLNQTGKQLVVNFKKVLEQ